MPFVPKKQAFNAHINEVVLGVGEKATAIGGQNVLPMQKSRTLRRSALS